MTTFSLSSVQSHRSVGVTPHKSNWSSPREAGAPPFFLNEGYQPSSPGCFSAYSLAMSHEDSIENLQVELSSLGRVEREAQRHERVRESLDSNSDRAVTHVAVLGLLDRVVINVDDAVQVERDSLDNVVEFLKVVNAVLDERWESDRCQIANGAVGTDRSMSGRSSEAFKRERKTDHSSGAEYSIISVHKLDDLIVPRFFWFDFSAQKTAW